MTGEVKQELDLFALADIIRQEGLDVYCRNFNAVKFFADVISAETGAAAAHVLPFFRIMLPYICRLVRFDQEAAFAAVTRKIHEAYQLLPFYPAVQTAILNLRKHLEKDAHKQELNHLRQRQADTEMLREIAWTAPDLRAQLSLLAEDGDISAPARERLAALGEKWEQILTEVNPQPELHGNMGVESTHPLLNGILGIPFKDRRKELHELQEFLYAPQRFSWWIVTGKGGVGKSRLAQELALRDGLAWRWGFLPVEAAFAWDQWQPAQPTLFIVDHAAMHRQQLREIIRTLARREDELECHTRFLLIERSIAEPWWQELAEDGGGDAVRALYAPDPFLLSSLPEQALWEILCGFIPAFTPPRAETMKALGRIDPYGRPLFAALTGMAMHTGRDVTQWDRTQLLHDVLKREDQRYWQPVGVTREDKNLLAFATLAGRLSLRDARLPELQIYFPEPKNYDSRKLKAVTGSSSSEYVAPVTPSILGEFFVLEHLKGGQPLEKARLAAILQAAWKQAPLHVEHFLNSCGKDFPRHASLPQLLASVDKPVAARDCWGSLAVHLIIIYGKTGQFAAAEQLLAGLAALAAGHPDAPELIMREAQGYFYLIQACCAGGRLDDAGRLYTGFAALAERHWPQEKIRRLHAETMTMLIAARGREGQPEAAAGYAAGLTRLAARFPDDAFLTLRFARGVVNLIGAYGSAMLEEAESAQATLTALARERAGLRELQVARAQGLFNLAAACCQTEKIAAAQSHAAALAALALEYPDLPELRLWRAKAEVNLLAMFGQAHGWEQAEAVFSGLAGQMEAYADELPLRCCYAQAAVSLIAFYGRVLHPHAAQRVHAALTDAVSKAPHDPDLRREFVRGTMNLVSAFGKTRQFAEAEHYYKLLVERAAHAAPGQAELLMLRAECAFSLLADYCAAQKFPEAERCGRELDALAGEHESAPRLRLWHAQGVLNLIGAYATTGQTKAARKIAAAFCPVFKTPEFAAFLREKDPRKPGEVFLFLNDLLEREEMAPGA